MYRGHYRTDSASSSASSSSTAHATTRPLSSASDDAHYDSIAWYQMPSVRRWKEKAAHAESRSAQEAPKLDKEHSHCTRDNEHGGGDDDDDDDEVSPSRTPWEIVESSPRTVFYSKSPAAPSSRAARTHVYHKSREPSTDADDGDDGTHRGPWGCPVKGCPKVLGGRDPKTWLRHLDSHWSHVYKRYSCPKCLCEFSRPESVMRHAVSKSSCSAVRPCEVVERVPCWTNPAYSKFFDSCSRLHPLHKTLHPAMEKARRGEAITHPPWPVLQPQIKFQ
ncbi:uncharacterized protein PHACADRAFT_259426 [Phanerochaete carnosa HHB-10118-sp]|uniref:Uncharacterized protein n=1 Tax=Phanerochaete carnosa (strain HHB-10118-sp) TaxID=650164 RepID=K5VP25_PHACS|nr:uncharacterized protein PHACADRAFT_259426 [Phanerochaete carnosa HHB-10118-sp]EKM53223.1 hypothetical protein PHACADRAFT_259426 [Phanerochaete carnosa HHB-10118-sp]